MHGAPEQPGDHRGPLPRGGTRRTAGRVGDRVLRTGVVGAGLVAQVVHLPSLRALAGRFALAGLADPSPRVREALGARYGVPAHADHRALIDSHALDALVVCSPNGTHADVVLDALDAGLHVLVEKPLCLDPADADRIAAARDAAGRVVQVGYMKRFEPAYEALLDDLDAGSAVRHVATAAVDPGLVAAMGPAGLVAGTDLPAAAAEHVRRRTAEQAGAAVGAEAPEAVAAYSDVFLGALVHDVNLVHGVLEELGVEEPARALDATAGAGAGTATAALPGGARWTMAWLLEPSAGAFREELDLYASDGVRRLAFPAPYVRPSAATYERMAAAGGGWATRTARGYRDAYTAQLEHFHACATAGAPCRTPVEQAGRDLALLADLFAAARPAAVGA